jgi:hypothetical protein
MVAGLPMEYCVLAFAEQERGLMPDDPIPVIDPVQAGRLARIVADAVAGVVVYAFARDPLTGDTADLWVLARHGRLPRDSDWN